MSDNLLIMEKEFHTLNEELQQKTHDIMKKVNCVRPTFVNEDQFNCNCTINQSYSTLAMSHVKSTHPESMISREEIDKQRKSSIKISDTLLAKNINVKIPLKRNNVLTNTVITNLLKGKIDILHKELEALQLKYKNKCEYFKELEVENKKLDETQVKLHKQIGFLNDTITKMESTNSDIISKLQILDNENINLKKDLDKFKKEVKILNQQSINYDVKLNKSLESNKKLKNLLRWNQIEEKELKNLIRKLEDDKRIAIKTLEKQRSELVEAFKKQMFLIDNLKKQNFYLMTNEQIRSTEEDFVKLLKWKPR